MFENYVYPPRPEKKIPTSSLKTFENMKQFTAQAKLNGSCCVAVCDSKTNFYNRHKETFAKFTFNGQELRDNYADKGLTIFCGEYLNKSQNDENGINTNNRLVLFDFIWYANKSLVGTQFKERQSMLRSIFKTEPHNKWLDNISTNLYIVKNFETGFQELWDEMIQHEIYEGLVLKKNHGILRPGATEANNTDWQVKCRKPTKNYTF